MVCSGNFLLIKVFQMFICWPVECTVSDSVFNVYLAAAFVAFLFLLQNVNLYNLPQMRSQ